MSAELLSELLKNQANNLGNKKCIIESISQKSLTYGELANLSSKFAEVFDHASKSKLLVGLLSDKCCEGVASIFGTYYSSNAFVPLPLDSPDERLMLIIDECQLDIICVHQKLLESKNFLLEQYLEADKIGNLHVLFRKESPERFIEKNLAYILYTSGSTGLPKGVMHGDSQALHFTNWSIETFVLTDKDIFSSVAPFNFDLSVFDLYSSISAGGTLILFEDKAVKNPRYLAQLVYEYQISIWYSTPSLFRLLARHGKLEKYQFEAMRVVLFAGEVLLQRDIELAREYWHSGEFYNLYGPTETNVCTFHKVNSDESGFPIGVPCKGMTYKILNDGKAEGELIIGGPTVALGYFNSSLNSDKFCEENGTQFYATGDVVTEDGEGNLWYRSRIDRMVKRRGYRIELNEIEKAIGSHPLVSEVAVVTANNEDEMIIKAFLIVLGEINSLVLNEHIAQKLPAYMLPDRYFLLDELPKTSSQKVDLKALENHE